MLIRLKRQKRYRRLERSKIRKRLERPKICGGLKRLERSKIRKKPKRLKSLKKALARSTEMSQKT